MQCIPGAPGSARTRPCAAEARGARPGLRAGQLRPGHHQVHRALHQLARPVRIGCARRKLERRSVRGCGWPPGQPGHSMRPGGHTALGDCAPGGARAPPGGLGRGIRCRACTGRHMCRGPGQREHVCASLGAARGAARLAVQGAVGGVPSSACAHAPQRCACTGLLPPAPARQPGRRAAGRPARRSGWGGRHAVRCGWAAQQGLGSGQGAPAGSPPSRRPAQELHRPARARGLTSGNIGLGPGACTPRARGRLGACRPPDVGPALRWTCAGGPWRAWRPTT
jgi:hypothetical protein